jgi:hypothetical protein|tara:strand:+ start:703 stop:1023 length:321 start_codon:yes stop_codon:yes gene_type:complete
MKINCRAENLIICKDNRLWPCCWTATARFEKSTYLDGLEKINPNWNSLTTNSIDDILNHHAFTDHFNDTHFVDNNLVDEVCVKNCNEVTIKQKKIKEVKDRRPTND